MAAMLVVVWGQLLTRRCHSLGKAVEVPMVRWYDSLWGDRAALKAVINQITIKEMR